MVGKGRERLSVAIVSGGLSHERDVSIRSGSRVSYALEDAGHDVMVVDFDARGLDAISANRPDVIVNMLHGGIGEDGTAQSLLELFGIPLVGAPAAAARFAFDKACASEMLKREGLAVPDSLVISASVLRELGSGGMLKRLSGRLRLPLVVKPRRGGSALGVAVVRETSEFLPALVSALRYDDSVLVQEYVYGREFAVGVVDGRSGPRCFTPIEVVVPNGVLFDYAQRYTAELVDARICMDLEGVDVSILESAAIGAFQSLGLRHFSRVDLIVRQDGVPVVLEAAIHPGMTETSLWPLAAKHSGLDFSEVWSSLIFDAVGSGDRSGTG